MKKIPLTQGKYALVDDKDFSELSKYKWFAIKNSRTYYAARSGKWTGGGRSGKRSLILMHRVVLNAKPNEVSDHRNGDGLDNRQTNLRLCTKAENNRNRCMQSNNTSGVRGVVKSGKGWKAQIRVNGKLQYLGVFGSKRNAGIAYKKASSRMHGEFARK